METTSHAGYRGAAPRIWGAPPAGHPPVPPAADTGPDAGRVPSGGTRRRRRRRRRSQPNTIAVPTAPATVGDAAGPVMVLFDVENQANNPQTLRAVLEVCRNEAGDTRAPVFAAVGSQNWDSYEPMCRALGVTVLPASGSASAADRVLLGVADAAAAVCPGLRFVVASGDHAFARLKPAVVVTRNKAGIAKTLTEAADRVRLVEDADVAVVVSLDSRRGAGHRKREATRARRARYRARVRARNAETRAAADTTQLEPAAVAAATGR